MRPTPSDDLSRLARPRPQQERCQGRRLLGTDPDAGPTAAREGLPQATSAGSFLLPSRRGPLGPRTNSRPDPDSWASAAGRRASCCSSPCMCGHDRRDPKEKVPVDVESAPGTATMPEPVGAAGLALDRGEPQSPGPRDAASSRMPADRLGVLDDPLDGAIASRQCIERAGSLVLVGAEPVLISRRQVGGQEEREITR